MVSHQKCCCATKLSKKTRILKKLTGHTRKQFALLNARVKSVAVQLSSPLGRKAKLDSLEDKILVLLIYYRTYINYEFLGFLIGLDQSNLCHLFKKLSWLCLRLKHQAMLGPLPQEAIKTVDLGYLGFDQEMSHVLLPHKRKKQTILSLGTKLIPV